MERKIKALPVLLANSNHLDFSKEAYVKLRNMEFVEKENHKSLRKNTPKCLKNWIWTIESGKKLWKELRDIGFPSFNLRFINQDLIENCFGQIRDNGRRNINPTPYNFCGSFKTLITTNLTSSHSLSANCEECKEGSSLALAEMFRVGEMTAEEEEKEEIEREVECSIPIL